MLSKDTIKEKIMSYVGNLRVSDIALANDEDIMELVVGVRISAVEDFGVETWQAVKRVLQASVDSCQTMRKLSIDLIDDIIEAM